MLEERLGAYVLLGNGNSSMVHHPEHNSNDEAIPNVISFLVEMIEKRMPGLEQPNGLKN